MKRRAFIAALGGAAAWPVVARGQQTERVRRIGVLTFSAESDQEGQSSVAAFREDLGELGWMEGVLDLVNPVTAGRGPLDGEGTERKRHNMASYMKQGHLSLCQLLANACIASCRVAAYLCVGVRFSCSP